MGLKLYVTIGISIFSSIGGYLPVLFGVSAFSIWSVVAMLIGGFFGVFVGYKAWEYVE